VPVRYEAVRPHPVPKDGRHADGLRLGLRHGRGRRRSPPVEG
jgi:hypothetical protein